MSEARQGDRAIPLLEGVEEAEVKRLLGVARRRRFDRGDIVFWEADPADTVHVVSKGRFGVRVTTPLGDPAMMRILGRGEVFGELGLVGSERTRSATVAALEPGETLAIYQADFERLRRDHPPVAEVLLEILAEQVRRLTDRLVEALHVPADTRIRRRLVELADVYGPESGEATIPLTQEELASVAGSTRPTVNRVLREEERRGTLRLARGRTVVLDRGELARRART